MSRIAYTPNLRPYDRDHAQPGIEAPSEIVGYTAWSIVAQQLTLVRFVPSRPMTLVSVAFVVSTADSADNAAYVALYDSALAQLAVSTSTTGKINSTGRKSISFTSSYTVQPKSVYYASLLVPTITGTPAVVAANFVAALAVQLPGASAPNVRAGHQNSQATPPANVTLASPPTNTIYPRLFLEE